MTEKGAGVVSQPVMSLNMFYMTSRLLYSLYSLYNGRVSSAEVTIRFRICLRHKNCKHVHIGANTKKIFLISITLIQLMQLGYRHQRLSPHP